MQVSFDVPRHLMDKTDILLDRVPYLSELILAMSYDQDDQAVNLTLSEQDGDSPQMQELRAAYMELCSSLELTRVIKERVVKSNLETAYERPAEPQGKRAAGLPYMEEFDILLLHKLDVEFTRIAQSHGAKLREYPSVLSKQNMMKNQYHLHFPQNIFGVASVPHNYKAINQFRMQAQQDAYEDTLLFEGEILQPCICYHCYEELQGTRSSEPRVLTGKGKCFRHEIQWRKDNFRRREFSMREIVYVGKEEWVVQMRQQIMEEVWRLFESFGLRGRIATATDPFFFSQDLQTKAAYQMMSNAKYELIATTSSGKNVSIASFNYCQDMLCSKYDIQGEDGAALHSGCVAFGIDRWKEAFMDRHGCDLASWPDTKPEKEMLI